MLHERISVENIPEQMRELTSELRHRAIGMANSMIGDGYPVPVAILLATGRVRDWAGLPHLSPEYHVVPHPEGWAVIRVDNEKPNHITDTKQEAIDKARTLSRNQKCGLVIHGEDGLVQREHSYVDG